MISEQEALKSFPSTSYRRYQKETVLSIVNALNSGSKCILLDAPTGSGKSYINTVFCRLLKSIYATPQLTLIDQVLNDPRVSKFFTEIKGRQNYTCYHNGHACSVGSCKQYRDFKCEKTSVCPYWIQKLKALEANSVLMSFSYLILEGKTETQYSFGKRELLVLDESHSIDRYALNHVNLSVSPYSLPQDFYEKISGSVPKSIESMSELKLFISAIRELIKTEEERYAYEQRTLEGLSLGKTIAVSKIENFKSKVDGFFESLSETEWVWQVNYITYKGVPSRIVIAQPLYSRWFMKEMVWSKADYFIISSATILEPKRFITEVGLDRVFKYSEITHIKVPSTFPVANRPIVDVSVGKMTKDKREDNIGKAIEVLEGILEIEKGNNVAVHARSYDFAKEIVKRISPKYKSLIITHDNETRESALQEWKSSRGKVFVCVAFTEGQDWKYDICRAQVLFKVPYPDLADRRVSRRLELKDWNWYYDTTLKETIQSYGRAVRSEYDKARFYVIDSSFWGLVRRCKAHLPIWFKDALPEDWEKSKKGGIDI